MSPSDVRPRSRRLSATPVRTPLRAPLRARAVAVGTAAALILAGCSTTAAADGGTTAGSSATGAVDTANTVLFDSSQVHSISVSYDDADYQAMIAAFQSTGEKQWISATVVIDGTAFTDVGIKLKGNSTLQGLRNGDSGNNAGPGGDVSADDPAGLPWRIRLDKFVDGQNYRGATDIVVRGGNTETSLNEAVALELIGAAGLATEEATPARFSVNGGTEALRLVIENPGDAWDEANFDGDGILYKAEAGGDYSYRGDDPASYTEVFEIEAAGDENADNYAPLIAFLRWLDESDDATFAAELGDHLDIDSFATYLAIQDLVSNSDDIDGPGNNSYLRYDTATGKFTVVAWDQNLSFGGIGQGGMGGPGPQAARVPQGGTAPPGAIGAPGQAGQPQADASGTVTQQDGPVGRGQGGGFGGRGGNALAEMFTANADFQALVDAATTRLTAELYASGTAQQILDSWTSVLQAQASDLVTAETITSEAAAVSNFFTAG